MKPDPVLVVIGTRPEAIKLAPVVYALSEAGWPAQVCLTGQHVELLADAVASLDIPVHHRLTLAGGDRNPLAACSSILHGMSEVLSRQRPLWTVVQGDTVSALAAALAAFHHGIPVAHVEAGLRSGDVSQPWPEEMYRRLISRLAAVHFAPTAQAHANLVAEGIEPCTILQTGNTVVDALRIAVQRLEERPELAGRTATLLNRPRGGRHVVLATVHRRETFGAPLAGIGDAFVRLAERGDCELFLLAHPNPTVTRFVEQLAARPNLHVIRPLEYFPFVALLREAAVILTDSGGIQEEAAALGKPVLVLRNRTERPEVMIGGNGRLVGWDTQRIVEETARLLDDPFARREMTRAHDSYGDGHAAARIVARLLAEPRSRP